MPKDAEIVTPKGSLGLYGGPQAQLCCKGLG